MIVVNSVLLIYIIFKNTHLPVCFIDLNYNSLISTNWKYVHLFVYTGLYPGTDINFYYVEILILSGIVHLYSKISGFFKDFAKYFFIGGYFCSMKENFRFDLDGEVRCQLPKR